MSRRDQVLDDCIGAATAQLVVVFLGAGRVGVTLNRHDEVLLLPNLLREFIERLLVGLGEHELTCAKQDRCIGNRLVVVEVLDGALQSAQVIANAGDALVGLLSRLAGCGRSLIGSTGSGDALLALPLTS